MIKRLLYLLCLGSLLLAGCNKEKLPFVVEGEYETGSIVQAAPIQLFTKDGLVDNQQVVNKFLRQRRWSNIDLSRVDVPVTGGSLKLLIGADKRALLVSKYGTRADTVKAMLTSQTDRYLVLSYADSITSRGLVTKPLPGQQNTCEQVAEKIRSEYPGIHYYPVAYASGTAAYSARVRPIVVIAIKNDQLVLPQFSWLVSSTHLIGSGPYTTSCGLSYSNERNVFNPAVVTQLLAGDTIVVQERGIPFQKK